MAYTAVLHKQEQQTSLISVFEKRGRPSLLDGATFRTLQKQATVF